MLNISKMAPIPETSLIWCIRLQQIIFFPKARIWHFHPSLEESFWSMVLMHTSRNLALQCESLLSRNVSSVKRSRGQHVQTHYSNPRPYLSTAPSFTVQPLRVVQPDAVCEMKVHFLVFHMGTWGLLPGADKQRNCTLARNKRTDQGRPFQSAYRGWSVPTKRCGDFEVNISLPVFRLYQTAFGVWLDEHFSHCSILQLLRSLGRFCYTRVAPTCTMLYVL